MYSNVSISVVTGSKWLRVMLTNVSLSCQISWACPQRPTLTQWEPEGSMSGVSTNQARLDRNKPKYSAVKGNDLYKVGLALPICQHFIQCAKICCLAWLSYDQMPIFLQCLSSSSCVYLFFSGISLPNMFKFCRHLLFVIWLSHLLSNMLY